MTGPRLQAVPDAPLQPRVTGWQRKEIEEARKLVMQVSELLDTRPHAYVAGLLEGAAANLLDILDAIAPAGSER